MTNQESVFQRKFFVITLDKNITKNLGVKILQLKRAQGLKSQGTTFVIYFTLLRQWNEIFVDF